MSTHFIYFQIQGLFYSSLELCGQFLLYFCVGVGSMETLVFSFESKYLDLCLDWSLEWMINVVESLQLNVSNLNLLHICCFKYITHWKSLHVCSKLRAQLNWLNKWIVLGGDLAQVDRNIQEQHNATINPLIQLSAHISIKMSAIDRWIHTGFITIQWNILHVTAWELQFHGDHNSGLWPRFTCNQM